MFLLRFLLILILTQKIFALSVSPTRINLSLVEPISTLVITNDNTESKVLHLSLVKWIQAQGKDVETPSFDLLLTPPIFSLAPFTSQLVRIGMETPLSQNRDVAYRLIISEVKPAFKKYTPQGITFLLRLSLPVVIETSSPRKTNIQWLVKKESGSSYLYAYNRGNTLVFINLISAFSRKHEQVVAPFSTFCYLLPNSQRKWKLNLKSSEAIKAVEANIDNQMVISNVA